MWYPAQLVYQNYKPDFLEKGMLFINIYNEGTEKETFEIFSLDKVPRDEDAFVALNGFPIELKIVDWEDEKVLAEHEQIGWMDFGDGVEHLMQISLKEINIMINEFNSWLDIFIDEEEFEENNRVSPVLEDDFVTVRFYLEDEEEEE
jgi:hypothetical protein